jgi:hypothetical protein
MTGMARMPVDDQDPYSDVFVEDDLPEENDEADDQNDEHDYEQDEDE